MDPQDPEVVALIPQLREALGEQGCTTINQLLEQGKEEGGLTDNVCYRFLRSALKDVALAKQKLTDWAAWRAQHPLGWVPKSQVQEQLSGDSIFLQESGKAGQPLIVLRVKNYTSMGDQQKFEQMLMFIMDQAVMRAQADVNPARKSCLMFDLDAAGSKNIQLVDLKALINCLQSYYVGRIQKIWIYNAPWFFSAIWKLASPFLSPLAKEVFQFVKKPDVPSCMETVYDVKVIPNIYGGQAELRKLDSLVA